MPIFYQIDEEKSITYVLWKGRITAYEFVEHVATLTSDPLWEVYRDFHVADLRSAIIDRSIDETVLAEVASLYGSYLYKVAKMKAAIITRTELQKAYFFADFFSHYGPAARVFCDMADAIEWLGIDAGKIESMRAQLQLRTNKC